jgi:hypothetical protein
MRNNRQTKCSTRAPEGLLWRCGNYLLILALLGATGGHWAVLQAIAWSGMLVENFQTDSWRSAVAKTFDGKHPCQMCNQIEAGKKTEKKSPLVELDKQLKFFCEKQSFQLAAPARFETTDSGERNYRSHLLRPPKPPPRVV